MQTKPSPNTPHGRMLPQANRLEMVLLEDAMDFLGQEARLVGLAKTAFSVGSGYGLSP